MVKEEVAVLIALVPRHRRAVGAAVRRAVSDEVPGAVEEEAGPAAVRRVPPGLLDALPVHALGALGIVVVVRDVGPRQVVCGDGTDAAHVLWHLRERAHHEDQHPAPEATNTGPGLNRGSGGGARGCDFEEWAGTYARTEGGRFL